MHEEVVFAMQMPNVFSALKRRQDKHSGLLQTNGIGRALSYGHRSWNICVSKGGFVECFSFDGKLLWSKNLKQWGKKRLQLWHIKLSLYKQTDKIQTTEK